MHLVQAHHGSPGFSSARLERLNQHFRFYVDDGRLPFVQLAIIHHGQLAHWFSYGLRDVEASLPVEDDAIFRIYSMTKPITTLAAMMLVEEGRIELGDDLAAYIPAFSAPRVWVAGSAATPVTVPSRRPIQVRDLMRHTAGLTYAHGAHPVDEMYKARGYEYGGPLNVSLEQVVDDWASLPLLFEPGTSWAYSHATDVLGRLIEVVSGKSLDTYFAERIFQPLGMVDTHFVVPPAKLARLAALYRPDGATGRAMRFDEVGREVIEGGRFLSGGGGLVSTTRDYLRFAEMLLRGGELDGQRLLGRKTLSYMTRNHLPGNTDLQSCGRPLFSEMPLHGVGFGLGFSVVVDPVKYGVTSSAGEYGWGGAASTTFLVDPEEDLTAVFMTQLIPSSTHPIRTQLRSLLYAALED